MFSTLSMKKRFTSSKLYLKLLLFLKMNANGRDFSSDDVSFVPKKHQLLKRPETAPLLTEFWQPPPTFDQHRRGKPKPRYTFEPGLNALWRADVLIAYSLRQNTNKDFEKKLSFATARSRSAFSLQWWHTQE